MNAEEVRRGWASRSAEYSPRYYAYYGPNETSEHVRETLARFVEPDDSVLELGCSSGRHLKHLHDHGFRDLHGVDINDDAFDVMADTYPDLADAGTFYHDAIEDAVGAFDDGRFDAVFSVETLQHVHADDEWVFDAIARITGGLLLTIECEEPVDGDRTAEDDRSVDDDRSQSEGTGQSGDGVAVSYENGDFPLYYRPWEEIFTRAGMETVETRSLERDTLWAFRHSGG